jgi:hypothetical protein
VVHHGIDAVHDVRIDAETLIVRPDVQISLTVRLRKLWANVGQLIVNDGGITQVVFYSLSVQSAVVVSEQASTLIPPVKDSAAPFLATDGEPLPYPIVSLEVPCTRRGCFQPAETFERVRIDIRQLAWQVENSDDFAVEFGDHLIAPCAGVCIVNTKRELVQFAGRLNCGSWGLVGANLEPPQHL